MTFTIGPRDDPEALKTYAKRLEHLGSEDMDAIILGILEGDVRTQCSLLSIEDIFNDRQKFKDIMITTVQEELDKVRAASGTKTGPSPRQLTNSRSVCGSLTPTSRSFKTTKTRIISTT